ncbi:MAG: hypothetical protein JWN60_144 [Acidobacteria bacterium]|jgi:hypothetical protein|nr:hypothetical protein [Acidobacteriota bacterium]
MYSCPVFYEQRLSLPHFIRFAGASEFSGGLLFRGVFIMRVYEDCSVAFNQN